MKNFKLNIAYLAVFAMIFASCSKEEAGIQGNDSEKVSLSFGAIVNDATTRASTKQEVGDIPECSSDEPAYVRIVLMSGDTEVVGTAASPYRVDLAPGQLFTVEDPLLELTPGTYTLTHFTVYNEDDEVIWIAPRDGALAGFVDNPLPQDIELNAGVKKYVEVDVLCYDNRDVNEYGYLFFEINTTEAIEFCVFANYCDADGRHYTARYSIDIWAGTDTSGDVLYSDLENVVGTNEDGDYFASPLCVALPSHAEMDVDYLYYEITLLDWEENYGDVDQATQVLSGTLSRADIEANFGENDEVEYEHFRFGCGGDDPTEDSDGDGIPDDVDDCPNSAGPASNNGCPDDTCDSTDPALDCDGDGTLNRCDSDNANYGTFDCDSDGFNNTADACVSTPGVAGGVGGDGCPADTGECIDESGEVVSFSGTVDVTGFPVGTDPFYPIIYNGEQVGVITFDLTTGVDEQLTVLVDMFDGTVENQFTSYTVTTAELSLPEIDDESLCVENIDQNEFSFTWDRVNAVALNYPLEVIFRANVLISME